MNPPKSKFCTYYVKSFAYSVSEFINLSKREKVTQYLRDSTHDAILETCHESVKCITNLCLSVRDYANLYKELPFFMHGFYYHFMAGDLDRAEGLYKDAIRRSEFSRGCFNMLVALYLKQTNFGMDRALLEQKFQALNSEFSHFFAYDKKVLQ